MADNNFVETVTITLEHYDRVQGLIREAKAELDKRANTIEVLKKRNDFLLEMFDMEELSESAILYDTVDKVYTRDFVHNKTKVQITFEVNELIRERDVNK